MRPARCDADRLYPFREHERNQQTSLIDLSQRNVVSVVSSEIRLVYFCINSVSGQRCLTWKPAVYEFLLYQSFAGD